MMREKERLFEKPNRMYMGAVNSASEIIKQFVVERKGKQFGFKKWVKKSMT